jgi:hypothetical protein
MVAPSNPDGVALRTPLTLRPRQRPRDRRSGAETFTGAAPAARPPITATAQRHHTAATDREPIFEDMTALTLTLQAPTAPLPLPARAPVADNASTDRTLAVAHELARELPRVRVVHLPQKGRGRALAAVWSTSDAPVLAYMDVDLSTDLGGLLPLVAPLIPGHSDVTIGSRLARGAWVVRGPQREFISRCYNLILRTVLQVRFSDAQCG